MRRLTAALAAALGVACGGGGSAPSAVTVTTTTLPVRASLTGTWELTLGGVPAGTIVPGITLGLTESSGSVSGVLQFAGDTEAPGVNGTISAARDLTLNAAMISLRAAVDATGRSFSGSYVVREDDGSSATFSVSAAKRSDAPPALTPNETRRSGQSRIDEVPFRLAAGSRNSVRVGPILAAVARTDVSMEYGGGYIILACVGTAAACTVTGGRETTTTFNIPGLYPAGPIQATVYFNPNFPQPAGDAPGFVRFIYNPQWR